MPIGVNILFDEKLVHRIFQILKNYGSWFVIFREHWLRFFRQKVAVDGGNATYTCIWILYLTGTQPSETSLSICLTFSTEIDVNTLQIMDDTK